MKTILTTLALCAFLVCFNSSCNQSESGTTETEGSAPKDAGSTPKETEGSTPKESAPKDGSAPKESSMMDDKVGGKLVGKLVKMDAAGTSDYKIAGSPKNYVFYHSASW